MLRSMLVALDGSPFSEAAVELGLKWAKRFDCQLAAVGIIDEPTIRGPQSTPVGAGAFKRDLDDTRVADCRRQVEAFLSRFAIHCSEAGVSCKVFEDVGWPCQEILREAQRYDLILIGRETYFHFETQRTSDETLQKILHSTPRPVVAVPDKPDLGDGVLIAFDGSIQAARAVQSFLATGLHKLEEVHIVSVHQDSKIEAARVADRATDFLRFHEIRSKQHPIQSHRRPGELLLEKAQELNVELIVMGCYGQSRIREFFLGSATQDVIQQSRVPMFLYH